MLRFNRSLQSLINHFCSIKTRTIEIIMGIIASNSRPCVDDEDEDEDEDMLRKVEAKKSLMLGWTCSDLLSFLANLFAPLVISDVAFKTILSRLHAGSFVGLSQMSVATLDIITFSSICIGTKPFIEYSNVVAPTPNTAPATAQLPTFFS